MDKSDQGEVRDHDEAGREPAPLRATNPSPGRSEVVSDGEIAAQLREVEAAEAERVADYEDRRYGDQQLLKRLREDSFSGPDYEIFADDLARYALPVLCAWMSSGYIFVLTAQHGHSLAPTDADRDQLRREPDLRKELAAITVAMALRSFRDRVLLADTWIAEGGASLTTYFTGCCVFEFPNEFRRHCRTQNRWRAQDAADRRGLITAAAGAQDPANVVAARLLATDRLARFDERTQAIVALRMDGYSHAEIAELLGETSVRAVEGVLHRLRKAEQARLKRKDES